jgi:predicted nuclease of restriction endonuclease-like RecB superfamily
MLTGKLLRVRYARNRIVPAYIDAGDVTWLGVAERFLELFRAQEGRTRGELEEDIRETFDSDPRQLVHQGLAKLLEDRCEFEVVSGHPPEQLRELVFQASAKAHAAKPPLAPLRRGVGGDGLDSGKENPSPQPLSAEGRGAFDRAAVLQEVAASLKLTPEAVYEGLFADLKSEQRLVRFKDISAERLLQRYNVALAQAVLLKAVKVKVFVRREPPQRYRQMMRAVKFHRLLCDVEKAGPDAYSLQLDGPLSLFTATQKYGLQLALFLPAILQCRDFELTAELRWGPERKPKTFTLGSSDGLISHVPDLGSYVPVEVRMFAELFRKKIATWEIAEETEVLPLGDGFWVPDFRLVHQATGRTVFLEVLGFWRKSSAVRHLERLRQHARAPFLLAVSDQLHIDEAELADLPAGIHRFRQMPLPDEVARLAEEQLAEG